MRAGLYAAVAWALMVPYVWAQGPFRLEIVLDPPTAAPGETVHIELWAHFQFDCAVATVGTNLLMSAHAQHIHDHALGYGFPYGTPGQVGIDGVREIQAHRIVAIGGIPTPYENPIMFWEADFVAPTDGPREVILATRTVLFILSQDCCGHCYSPISRLDELEEAFVVLRIDACRADIDGDGELTIFDFLGFQNLFDAGDLQADFDGDGSLSLFDFLAFQNEFDAGCA
ncbi:MAG: GC-type dockerin domain-anchored protein [Phycisphaerales bacterium]